MVVIRTILVLAVLLLANFASPVEHKFIKRTKDGPKTVVISGIKEKIIVRKIFVTLEIGEFIFRKKSFFGKRESGKFR